MNSKDLLDLREIVLMACPKISNVHLASSEAIAMRTMCINLVSAIDKKRKKLEDKAPRKKAKRAKKFVPRPAKKKEHTTT